MDDVPMMLCEMLDVGLCATGRAALADMLAERGSGTAEWYYGRLSRIAILEAEAALRYPGGVASRLRREIRAVAAASGGSRCPIVVTGTGEHPHMTGEGSGWVDRATGAPADVGEGGWTLAQIGWQRGSLCVTVGCDWILARRRTI